ncbi:MAG: integration host factor subunit alpha [Rhodobiaceae bacterium]|nr:integration host factor subunit alpha [Rhodobiaceae bacterium]MBJ65873.1 integration host factor subunit alpha [Rhodobiaceae bacterium]|tara:strand:- start:14 stop:301 length:288 start_codon:yes stop_codon:yes gene_type:complete
MTDTLTRAELAELIYSEVGISKTEASEIVDQFFEEIINDLVDGNSVKLTSFGTFSVRHKKERIGRNPKTKEEAIIDARRVISFRASKELKKRINS